MKKLYLYPLWLRFWHWINAILFIILIFTGISMHYSGSHDLFMPFDVAMVTHNITGILLTFVFVFYTIMNIASGNYKYYITTPAEFLPRMVKQARYYIWGIFKGEDHPYHVSLENKFNPLQKLSYFAIMFFMVPFVIISGWLLMLPELAPSEFLGMGGVWPMAIAHSVIGFFLSVFMIGHIYLATHGTTISENFISMFTGYHYVHDETENHNTNNDKKNSENKEKQEEKIEK